MVLKEVMLAELCGSVSRLLLPRLLFQVFATIHQVVRCWMDGVAKGTICTLVVRSARVIVHHGAHESGWCLLIELHLDSGVDAKTTLLMEDGNE